MLATTMRRAARCARQTRAVRIACAARSTRALAPAIARAAVRSFSAASDGNATNSSSSNGAPPSHVIDAVDENRFLELADTALHDIMSWLDGVEEMLEESDVSLSQGVLKIDLGENGTWVINRQIPNRQLWWSSPISGPRRYEFDAASGTWRNTRDGTELMELLRNEIFEATGIEIYE